MLTKLIPALDSNFLFRLNILETFSSLSQVVSNALVEALCLSWGWTLYDLIPLFAIVCAAAVPYVANPVHSLLALIFCFLSISIILIASSAEFLGYLFLIVYVGAIAILFLFVIMLLNVRQLTATTQPILPRPTNFFSGVFAAISSCIVLKFLTGLFFAIEGVTKNGDVVVHLLPSAVNYRGADILAFSELLYTQHAALFTLATLLLLSAMIGAIVLAANSAEQN